MADPKHFDADPDPTFHADVDPDPNFLARVRKNQNQYLLHTILSKSYKTRDVYIYISVRMQGGVRVEGSGVRDEGGGVREEADMRCEGGGVREVVQKVQCDSVSLLKLDTRKLVPNV